jgi:hypothetical protein
METARPLIGLSTIAFALAFNAPYAVLAATYDYPDILRRPAAEALEKFADGGPELILTWHAFALAALALVPLAVAVSISKRRLAEAPGLTLAAALFGALAGLSQAIGLWRWVFVVPTLARMHADPAAAEATRNATEASFALLNLYGGVAIGEHLGQWLTALFVAALAMVQWRERARIVAGIGFAAAATIAIGTTEGLAIALNASGDVFAMFTIVGFLLLTAWLIGTGLTLLRGPRPQPSAD